MAEMARRAMEKRKGATAEGSIAKKVKLSFIVKAPIPKSSSSSIPVLFGKSKVSSIAVDMPPLSFAPLE